MAESPRPAGSPIATAPPERDRPSVDVVIPFLGSRDELEATQRRLEALRLRAGDSLTVADNTPASDRRLESGGRVRLLQAADRRTPGFARDRAAARGHAEGRGVPVGDGVPSSDLL